jgi:hypothetical protein
VLRAAHSLRLIQATVRCGVVETPGHRLRSIAIVPFAHYYAHYIQCTVAIFSTGALLCTTAELGTKVLRRYGMDYRQRQYSLSTPLYHLGPPALLCLQAVRTMALLCLQTVGTAALLCLGSRHYGLTLPSGSQHYGPGPHHTMAVRCSTHTLTHTYSGGGQMHTGGDTPADAAPRNCAVSNHMMGTYGRHTAVTHGTLGVRSTCAVSAANRRDR